MTFHLPESAQSDATPALLVVLSRYDRFGVMQDTDNLLLVEWVAADSSADDVAFAIRQGTGIGAAESGSRLTEDVWGGITAHLLRPVGPTNAAHEAVSSALRHIAVGAPPDLMAGLIKAASETRTKLKPLFGGATDTIRFARRSMSGAELIATDCGE